MDSEFETTCPASPDRSLSPPLVKTMSSLNRRSFLKTTAAAGLASLPAARGSLALPANEDPLGVRKDFPVTLSQTYINSAYVGPMPKVASRRSVPFRPSSTRRV